MGKHFSNKHFSKKRRRNIRSFETAEIIEFQHSKFEVERSLPPLLPLNPAQATYIDLETPAIQKASKQFAETLVTSLLEGF